MSTIVPLKTLRGKGTSGEDPRGWVPNPGMYGRSLNPLQHALKRPDTYLGSIATTRVAKAVLEGGSLKEREVDWNEGLFNAIREIASNCVDHKWRSEEEGVPMKKVKVSWHNGSLSFWNDGSPIPVVLTKYGDREAYPAEMFFGEMLSGTNFDDEKVRKTSGRNGMGAKCTNVFSKRFEVEHADPRAGKKFLQVYEDNATKKTAPWVSTYAGKTAWTKVTFEPDFERFLFSPGDDFVGLLGATLMEVAATMALPVFFSSGGVERRFFFPSFEKYVKEVCPSSKTASAKLPNGDEFVVAEEDGEDFRCVSFVNGLRTKDGGVHVTAWKEAIFPSFVKAFNARKEKAPKATSKDVFQFVRTFVRAEVDKPSFDSQTKGRMNGPPYSARGGHVPPLVKKMLRWEFVKRLETKLAMKSEKRRPPAKRVNLGERARDANKAGTGADCVLFVTEGPSAKAMVVRGLSFLPGGQDLAGVFAVQGKFINASNYPPSDVFANEEASLLKKMLNLRPGADYSLDEEWRSLRYRKVRLTTDMDEDGIHIRGLLLNFFWTFWPQLLGRGFVDALSTAVTKVTFQSSPPMLFFSRSDYVSWYDTKEEKIKEVKYLKGLGSINPKDVPGYFSSPKKVEFFAEGDEKDYMALGFDETKSEWRKEWLLRDGERHDVVYDGRLGISTFVDTQLIVYHKATLSRALPCFVDSFKESQRKVFFAIRSKRLSKTRDLEKIMGAVKERTNYHHGGASLLGTIRNMACRFPGSNNLPLLQDDGEFGTRLAGGKDAAAARYIATNVEAVSNLVFPRTDDPLLTDRVEDDEKVEPEFFLPVICMLLVNGAEGIASGFSTSIPNHDPLKVIDWTLAWLRGEEGEKLLPWYRGIDGAIEVEGTRWTSKGVLKRCGAGCQEVTGRKGCSKGPGWWHITDLPPGRWTNKVRSALEGLLGKENGISAFDDHSTSNRVHFVLKPCGDWDPEEFKALKSTKSLTNMVALDELGVPTRFATAEEILERWCPLRLSFFVKRKEAEEKALAKALERERAKAKFVGLVVEGSLNLFREDEVLKEDLRVLGNYDFLSMSMGSMTARKVRETEAAIEKLSERLASLRTTTPKELWEHDLLALRDGIEKFCENNPLK